MADEFMDSVRIDFADIVLGILFTISGIIAIIISIFRLRRKEYVLLSAGIFFFIYGIRWFDQIPSMGILFGYPFNSLLFDTILTYILIIPLSAFLMEIFGKGFYNSFFWVLISTIVYAFIAIPLISLNLIEIPQPAINPFVVIIWCLVWALNLVFIKDKSQIELKVLRTVSAITLICVAHDQLVNMSYLPWRVHLEHIGLLLFFAGMAFVTVHNIFSNEKKLMVIQQEIEIARQIQKSNLPQNLIVPNDLSIATKYIPMSTVAGDFYDYQNKDALGFGILIADVSGHGIGAALIGSMLKIAYASLVKNISDPAIVLSEINRIMIGKIENSFVTACSIFIDIGKSKLYYSNAGHPQALLYRKSRDKIIKLPIGGTIMGIFPDSEYQNFELDILNDDRLVLYTDGISETMNMTGELFGEDRLISFIREGISDSPNQLADKIIKNLLRWSGKQNHASFEDDLTLIILDYNRRST